MEAHSKVTPIRGTAHAAAASAAERQSQLHDYNAQRKEERELEEGYLRELWEYWAELAGGQPCKYPSAAYLRHYLRIFAIEDIKTAMEIAMDTVGDWQGCRYLTGILRNWDKQGEITL